MCYVYPVIRGGRSHSWKNAALISYDSILWKFRGEPLAEVIRKQWAVSFLSMDTNTGTDLAAFVKVSPVDIHKNALQMLA